MNLLAKIFVAVVAFSCFIGAAMEWHGYLQGGHTINESRRIVLEIPIRLEQDFSISQSFTVDVAATYWLDIECQKTNSPETLNAILANELAVEVIITNDASIFIHEDSFQSNGVVNSDDHIERHISIFKALPSVHYNLVLHVIRSSPVLAKSQSVMKISIGPRALENLYMGTSISAYKAVGWALLGLLCSFLLLECFRPNKPADGQMS